MMRVPDSDECYQQAMQLLKFRDKFRDLQLLKTPIVMRGSYRGGPKHKIGGDRRVTLKMARDEMARCAIELDKAAETLIELSKLKLEKLLP